MKAILKVNKSSAYAKFNGQSFEVKEVRISENQILGSLRVLFALELEDKNQWGNGTIADFYVNENICEVKFSQETAQSLYESILWHGSVTICGVEIYRTTFENICVLMGVEVEYTCPA